MASTIYHFSIKDETTAKVFDASLPLSLLNHLFFSILPKAQRLELISLPEPLHHLDCTKPFPDPMGASWTN